MSAPSAPPDRRPLREIILGRGLWKAANVGRAVACAEDPGVCAFLLRNWVLVGLKTALACPALVKAAFEANLIPINRLDVFRLAVYERRRDLALFFARPPGTPRGFTGLVRHSCSIENLVGRAERTGFAEDPFEAPGPPSPPSLPSLPTSSGLALMSWDVLRQLPAFSCQGASCPEGSALELACLGGDSAMVTWLMEEFDLCGNDFLGECRALPSALISGNFELFARLMEAARPSPAKAVWSIIYRVPECSLASFAWVMERFGVTREDICDHGGRVLWRFCARGRLDVMSWLAGHRGLGRGDVEAAGGLLAACWGGHVRLVQHFAESFGFASCEIREACLTAPGDSGAAVLAWLKAEDPEEKSQLGASGQGQVPDAATPGNTSPPSAE